MQTVEPTDYNDKRRTTFVKRKLTASNMFPLVTESNKQYVDQ